MLSFPLFLHVFLVFVLSFLFLWCILLRKERRGRKLHPKDTSSRHKMILFVCWFESSIERESLSLSLSFLYLSTLHFVEHRLVHWILFSLISFFVVSRFCKRSLNNDFVRQKDVSRRIEIQTLPLQEIEFQLHYWCYSCLFASRFE